jgi:MFS transporter, FHS family, L-fucose permease
MKHKIGTFSFILSAFFIIGFYNNITGAILPDVISSFSVNYTLAALLPFSIYFAYGIVSIPAGLVIERINNKKILIFSLAVCFLVSLAMLIFPNYATVLTALFICGAATAAIQVLLPPLIRRIGGEENLTFNLTLVQIVFFLAAYFGPLLYSVFVNGLYSGKEPVFFVFHLFERIVSYPLRWISVYWIFLFLNLILLVWAIFIKYPHSSIDSKNENEGLANYLLLMKNKTVIMYFLAVFFYVGIEQGISNWMSKFLNYYHNLNPQTSGATAVSWFWGSYTIGSLIGLFFIKIIDVKKILLPCSVTALILFIIGLFGNPLLASVMFPLSGLFLAPLWSITFSLGMNSLPDNHGAFSGILSAAIIGGALMPLLMGFIGDIFGLRAGFFVLIPAFIFVISISFWAKPLVKNKIIVPEKNIK